MHERKMTMFERSDGFVALPGGLGTLEELVEISTWAQLDRHAKPIIVCDINDYWAPLITLINHMRQEKFIREGLELKLDVVKTPHEVVSVFEDRLKQSTAKVPHEPIRKTL
jgi:uncharacterized protein (TIGR00730 family)